MKLEVEYKLISNSPFDYTKGDSFFTFTQIEVDSLLNCIQNLNEGCYFISGYRGVGKTSFIKKIEQSLKSNQEYVFIHVTIARHENFEVLIRRFIRQFYIQLVESGLCEKLINQNRKNAEIEDIVSHITWLNIQTFSKFETEYNLHVKKERILRKEISINIIKISTLIISLFALLISIFQVSHSDIILKIAIIINVIFQAFNFNFIRTKINSKSKEKRGSIKSFYDDDIAEYEFNKLLTKIKLLSDITINPIFVIDELDKLSVSESKKVLSSFKSTLLSGNADFIVIGGQDLYYDLYLTSQAEDTMLSTLFSKSIHVKLKSRQELRNLFDKIILNKGVIDSNEKYSNYSNYINGLVYNSRRIPRKFINLIIENLIFENGKAYIYISEFQEMEFEKILSLIERIVENANIEQQAIKDHIILNLIIHSKNLLNFNTKSEILNYISDLDIYE